MPIPDYETLMLPLLSLAAEKPSDELLVLSAVESLANKFKLTDEEQENCFPVEPRSIFPRGLAGAAPREERQGFWRLHAEAACAPRNADSTR